MDDIGDVFDPEADVLISEHCLPHWAQAGAITFVTIRLADSIPQEVVRRWDRERVEFLNRRGVPCHGDWRADREQLSRNDRIDFERQFRRAREVSLDDCVGNCELRHPEAAQIVADSLLHFDGQRYAMGDFVVMPNHVHLLVVCCDAESLVAQCGGWMRFTARKINQLLCRSGALWDPEPFDHLVRSERQLEYLRSYIKTNPQKARLKVGESLYRRSKRHF